MLDLTEYQEEAIACLKQVNYDKQLKIVKINSLRRKTKQQRKHDINPSLSSHTQHEIGE